MNVTVFGGALPQPGEPTYEEGLLLGRLLARSGHTVLTGGYKGVMESVSRGAAEAGGHVIGVTCTEIEDWRKTSANLWVKEEWKAETLIQRLDLLVHRCEAAVAMPGGIGTLTELTLYWNMLLIEALPPRPLVLVGSGWTNMMEGLRVAQGQFIHEKDWGRVTLVGSVEEAVSVLNYKTTIQHGISNG
jgi:uncharacterized protein (TIGR00730 family)